MLQLKILLLLFCLCNLKIVSSRKTINKCQTNITDVTRVNKPIEDILSYCGSLKKTCISKCCGPNEVLNKKILKNGKKKSVCANPAEWSLVPNYTKLAIHDSVMKEKKIVSKHFNDFHLIQNPIHSTNPGQCFFVIKANYTYLLDDGTVRIINPNQPAELIGPESYCTDLVYDNGKQERGVIFFAKQEEINDKKWERTFVGVALVISSTFLVPVLVTYSVLPQRRNLSGMLLMAYVSTQLSAFMFQVIRLFFSNYVSCALVTIPFYFCHLSCFFWLNIMSFDIWWTFRGIRLKRKIHRRGIMVKFGWYSLYAWGSPLGTVIIAAIIGYNKPEVGPYFAQCMNYDWVISWYMRAPTGVLTLVNIVLFLMTVYNIWLIRITLNKHKGTSSTTKQNENRLGLYVKMSMLMGISWLLEFTSVIYPEDLPLWAFIPINSYNAFIGVVIFLLFIANKKTLKLICQRFQIPCHFVEDNKFCPNSSSRSTTVKSSRSNRGSYHKTATTDESDQEIEDVETNPNPSENPCT